MSPKLTALRNASANTPLRVQLMGVVLVLMVLALLIVGFTATSALRGYLVDRADSQLIATARDQGRQQLRQNAAPNGDDDDRTRFPPQRPALLSGFYTETVDATGVGVGQLVLPEGSSQSEPKLPTLTAATVASLGTKPFTVGSSEGDSQWRVLVSAMSDGSGAYVTAINLSDVEETVDTFRNTVLLVSVIALLLCTVLGYILVRARLRKLVAVERTAERIAAGDLSQRVPAANERTEVGRVAAAINAMMGQIESAFAAQSASEAEARVSESRMRRFVADASHELRTPLTSIRGFAELQRQHATAGLEAPPHAVDRIESEAQRMSMLVEDLLMLARLDQQRPLDIAPVDLYDLVADAVRDATVIAPNRSVTMVIDPALKEYPFVVMGDEMRLRQVLTNLTSNAYTHTPDATPVEVALRKEGNDAVIDVIDHGPGMSREDAERVFERFYRSDTSRTRASGGTGLGLSIVMGLVEAHNGTVTVSTEQGKGATFSVRLPLITEEDD